MEAKSKDIIPLKSAPIASAMLSINPDIWNRMVDDMAPVILKKRGADYQKCCEIADSMDSGHVIEPYEVEFSSELEAAVCEAEAIIDLADMLKKCNAEELVGAARIVEIYEQRRQNLHTSESYITNEMLVRFF